MRIFSTNVRERVTSSAHEPASSTFVQGGESLGAYEPVAPALVVHDEGSVAQRLSVRRLLVFVFMAVVFTLAVRPITDPDFWWHMRAGRLIFETRRVPTVDVFSSTFAGREWVAHEWLSELTMYLIQQALGYAGLVVCFSLIISAAMWLAYRRCAQHAGHPYVAGFAVLVGALASSPTWGVRPQIFSFLFASIFLAFLDDFARDRNRGRVWWLVPLTALWANMHAGFAMGLALIALTFAGLALDELMKRGEAERDNADVDAQDERVCSPWRRVRVLLFVLCACVLAVSLNPLGARLYLYPFETLTSQAMMKHINEWFSPDFHEPMFQPLAALLFATFAAMALSKRRVRPGSLLLLVATGYAALRSARNVPFFALVAMPLLAEHAWAFLTRQSWGAWLAEPERREAGAQAALKVALNLLLLGGVPLALCFVRVGQVEASRASDEAKNFPASAVEFMRETKPPQPVFNEYGWGGYMIWKLYPDYRVYIDGRADVYGDAYLEEFLKTHDGIGDWRAPLERESVRTVLVKPDAPLASLLREDDGWRKAFEDEQAVIFIRE